MPAPIFIGDEVSAIGYRLAGAWIRTPKAEEIEQELERAAKITDLVIITRQFLQMLPQHKQSDWLCGITPALVVVEDIRDEFSATAVADQLRAQLGILA